jgi:hypothetical protein
LWTSGLIKKYHKCVVSGTSVDQGSGMVATGIPPYVLLAHRLSNVEHILQDVRNDLKELPSRVCNEVLSHCQVEGAVPITANQFQQTLEVCHSKWLEEMKTYFQLNAQLSHIASPISHEAEGVESGSGNEMYTTWIWDGKIHPVPRDFRFPT